MNADPYAQEIQAWKDAASRTQELAGRIGLALTRRLGANEFSEVLLEALGPEVAEKVAKMRAEMKMERAEVEKWASGEWRTRGIWADGEGLIVLTPERCVEMGGHCWDGELPRFVSPQVRYRTCKHCGKRQVGTPQESIDWRDA